jgi:phage terminase large subunit GpA-like protein
MKTKSSYRTYLKSRDWARKRQFKYYRRQWCSICGSDEQLNVHHLFYRNEWKQTRHSDLRVLCHRCHELGHELMAQGLIKLKLGQVIPHEHAFEKLKAGVLKALGLDPSHKAKETWLLNQRADEEARLLDQEYSWALQKESYE